MKWRGLFVVVAGAAAVSACSLAPKDTSPTLKSLEKKSVPIQRNVEVKVNPERAKQSYEAILQSNADDVLKRRAMRRLADLEMQGRGDAPLPETTAEGKPSRVTPPASQGPDIRKAIKLYESLIQAAPNGKENDRIYYQLARAYEQVGELEKSLSTLTALVDKYPQTVYHDEAEFRRGELYFTFQEFAKSEAAFKAALTVGKRSPFYERATYKLGWAIYKQDRFKDALPAFLSLIDLKLGNKRLGDKLDDYEFLSRGDKELTKDVFRVTSLCFSKLDGPKSINSYFAKRGANYEFLLYRNLGDMYLQQERYVDAATAYSAFGEARPEHPQNILMQIDAIELYQERGFADRVLDGKKELAIRYGKYVEFWANNTHYGFDEYLMRSDKPLEQKIEDYVIATLEELGRFYHNRAQKTKNQADYQEAAKWYQSFLRTFSQNPKAAEINYLLAAILYEDKRFAESIREYEKTAYNYNRHKQATDAGYNALLAYEEYKKTLAGPDLEFWNRLSLQSAERFSKLFPRDPRTSAVLVKVVTELFEKKQFDEAAVFAQRILAVAPDSDAKVRMQAMSIIAHTDFEAKKYKQAEDMYGQILAITPAADKNRQGIVDRLAASIYKQGETLRDAGDLEGSTNLFMKVAQSAPTSAIRPTADFDAAANLINMKQWVRAIPLLEAFQKNFPTHQLAGDVSNKLAVAYLESGDNNRAADYLQKIAGNDKDKNTQLGTVWQAAELYEKAKNWDAAIGAYKRAIKDFSPTAEQSLEARQKIVDLYGKLNETNSQRFWQKDITEYVKPTDPALTDRARFLGSKAAMALAEPAYQSFKSVKLTAPLKDSIARKKRTMEDAIKAYDTAAAYRLAEVTTESTYRIGEIYGEFSEAILKSERPKGLSADALEQYELVLEEQADPFVQKSIELHEANVTRVGQGIYDDWIKKSFTALSTLLPVRYGKLEKVDGVINEIK